MFIGTNKNLNVFLFKSINEDIKVSINERNNVYSYISTKVISLFHNKLIKSEKDDAPQEGYVITIFSKWIIDKNL